MSSLNLKPYFKQKFKPNKFFHSIGLPLCLQRFRFPSPVLRVQFHPRNENILLVVPMKHAPVVVNVATGTHRQEDKILFFLKSDKFLT